MGLVVEDAGVEKETREPMGRKSIRKQLEADNISARRLSTSPRMCTCDLLSALRARSRTSDGTTELILENSVQVNIPAESGEMGILANHVPAIEQLKPGLVEIIEEAGASKQFFRTSNPPSQDPGII